MKFTITKSELGFLSDLLAGAQTPRALLNIGNFIGHANVSASILGYQNDLQELVEAQKTSIGNLAKEYFQQDANGNPLTEKITDPIHSGEMIDKWVLIEGKDEKEFQELYTTATNEAMKARSDLGLVEVAIDVEDNVFYNFKNSVLDDVKIIDCAKALGILKPGPDGDKDLQNFTGVLYNVLAKIDTISA